MIDDLLLIPISLLIIGLAYVFFVIRGAKKAVKKKNDFIENGKIPVDDSEKRENRMDKKKKEKKENKEKLRIAREMKITEEKQKIEERERQEEIEKEKEMEKQKLEKKELERKKIEEDKEYEKWKKTLSIEKTGFLGNEIKNTKSMIAKFIQFIIVL